MHTVRGYFAAFDLEQIIVLYDGLAHIGIGAQFKRDTIQISLFYRSAVLVQDLYKAPVKADALQTIILQNPSQIRSRMVVM